LLFTYFIGMAVAGGAYLNAAIQELWPAHATRRQRRKWRKLARERVDCRSATSSGRSLRQRTTTPLRAARSGRSDTDEEHGLTTTPDAQQDEPAQDNTSGDETEKPTGTSPYSSS